MAAALNYTNEWAKTSLKELNDSDPLRILFDVNEDILGVYRYKTSGVKSDDRAINRASIELYWAVIGLVAGYAACTVEDLTVVVLTHELAHAYTQLGADADGGRWQARRFASAGIAVVEGLAQYYSRRFVSCCRGSRVGGASL